MKTWCGLSVSCAALVAYEFLTMASAREGSEVPGASGPTPVPEMPSDRPGLGSLGRTSGGRGAGASLPTASPAPSTEGLTPSIGASPEVGTPGTEESPTTPAEPSASPAVPSGGHGLFDGLLGRKRRGASSTASPEATAGASGGIQSPEQTI